MRNLQSFVFSSRLLVLGSLLATAACSGGTANPPDASTEGGTDAGKKDAALPPSDAGPGDDGATPTIDPECTVPSGSPSNGSCVVLDDAGVACNPVTNAGCNGDAGESCDIANDGTIQCFAPPPPNTNALCATCDSNTECLPGSSCWPATGNPNGECMRFCCTDADCGGGHCDKATFQTDPLGFCAK